MSDQPMNTDRDPVDLLGTALAQTARLIDGTRPEQAAAPTPCRSWDVGRLVSHIVHDLRQFTVRAQGGTPNRGPDFPTVDAAEWQTRFRDGSAELLSAWRDAGGPGEGPARFTLSQQTAEFAVHGWDLGRATGQRLDGLDEEVALASLAWGRGALQPQYRGSEEEGSAFGPEAPTTGDASPYDRLAAFFGRTPPPAAAA